MSRLHALTQAGRVLLMDGAMGTELQRAGIPEGSCLEAWNLTHPEKVLAIHQTYVDAGAELVLTNTFQANRKHLHHHNMEGSQEAIWSRGIDLARRASANQVLVGADLGPGAEDEWEHLVHLATTFQADCLWLETLADGRALTGQIKGKTGVAKSLLPVIGSFAFMKNSVGDYQTAAGLSPGACARMAEQLGCFALGVNCGRDIGLGDVAAILRQFRAVTNLPLVARPNAGTPTKVEGLWQYPITPARMAAAVPAMLEAGAIMIGGCCGTTPAHIRAMRAQVNRWNAQSR